MDELQSSLSAFCFATSIASALSALASATQAVGTLTSAFCSKARTAAGRKAKRGDGSSVDKAATSVQASSALLRAQLSSCWKVVSWSLVQLHAVPPSSPPAGTPFEGYDAADAADAAPAWQFALTDAQVLRDACVEAQGMLIRAAAEVEAAQGRVHTAISYTKKALDFTPPGRRGWAQNVTLLCNVGALYASAGNHTSAVTFLTEALDLANLMAGRLVEDIHALQEEAVIAAAEVEEHDAVPTLDAPPRQAALLDEVGVYEDDGRSEGELSPRNTRGDGEGGSSAAATVSARSPRRGHKEAIEAELADARSALAEVLTLHAAGMYNLASQMECLRRFRDARRMYNTCEASTASVLKKEVPPRTRPAKRASGTPRGEEGGEEEDAPLRLYDPFLDLLPAPPLPTTTALLQQVFKNASAAAKAMDTDAARSEERRAEAERQVQAAREASAHPLAKPQARDTWLKNSLTRPWRPSSRPSIPSTRPLAVTRTDEAYDAEQAKAGASAHGTVSAEVTAEAAKLASWTNDLLTSTAVHASAGGLDDGVALGTGGGARMLPRRPASQRPTAKRSGLASTYSAPPARLANSSYASRTTSSAPRAAADGASASAPVSPADSRATRRRASQPHAYEGRSLEPPTTYVETSALPLSLVGEKPILGSRRRAGSLAAAEYARELAAVLSTTSASSPTHAGAGRPASSFGASPPRAAALAGPDTSLAGAMHHADVLGRAGEEEGEEDIDAVINALQPIMMAPQLPASLTSNDPAMSAYTAAPHDARGARAPSPSVSRAARRVNSGTGAQAGNGGGGTPLYGPRSPRAPSVEHFELSLAGDGTVATQATPAGGRGAPLPSSSSGSGGRAIAPAHAGRTTQMRTYGEALKPSTAPAMHRGDPRASAFAGSIRGEGARPHTRASPVRLRAHPLPQPTLPPLAMAMATDNAVKTTAERFGRGSPDFEASINRPYSPVGLGREYDNLLYQDAPHKELSRYHA